MMVAEQATRSRYRLSASTPEREIRLTARIEVPGEEGVDVETLLLYDPGLPPPVDDRIHRQLYDGVHAGLAAAGTSLAPDGIRVVITELRISPPLAADAGEEEVRSVGETIHALTAAAVSSLWAGLNRSVAALTP